MSRPGDAVGQFVQVPPASVPVEPGERAGGFNRSPQQPGYHPEYGDLGEHFGRVAESLAGEAPARERAESVEETPA